MGGGFRFPCFFFFFIRIASAILSSLYAVQIEVMSTWLTHKDEETTIGLLMIVGSVVLSERRHEMGSNVSRCTVAVLCRMMKV